MKPPKIEVPLDIEHVSFTVGELISYLEEMPANAEVLFITEDDDVPVRLCVYEQADNLCILGGPDALDDTDDDLPGQDDDDEGEEESEAACCTVDHEPLGNVKAPDLEKEWEYA